MRRTASLLIVIIAVTLLAERALRSQAVIADLVIVNAKVYTVDRTFSTAEAVAVTNGKFTAVGSNAQIRRLIGPKTTVMDVGGKTIIPGLQDGHLHGAGGGPGVDLSQARTIADALSQVAARVKQ